MLETDILYEVTYRYFLRVEGGIPQVETQILYTSGRNIFYKGRDAMVRNQIFSTRGGMSELDL